MTEKSKLSTWWQSIKPKVKYLASEVWESLKLFWRYLVLWGTRGWSLLRQQFFAWKLSQAKGTLAEAMLAADVGDASVRTRIREIEEEVTTAQAEKQSTRILKRERREQLNRLLDTAPQPTPEAIAAEAMAVKGIEGEIDRLKTNDAQKDALLPSTGIDWRRLAVGASSCCFSIFAVLLVALITLSSTADSTRSTAFTSSDMDKDDQNAFAALREEDSGLVGIDISEEDGKMVISAIVVGSPAQEQGVRPGDEILALGPSSDSLISVEGKTVEEVLNLVDGSVGQPLCLRLIPHNQRTPIELRIVRRARFDDKQKGEVIRWASTGYRSHIPYEILTRFPGSNRHYQLLDNQSQLVAFPEEYLGSRVAVCTDLLLFPKVDSERVTLRMFHNMESPVAYVNRLQTPRLFEAVVRNDPTTHEYCIMHVKLWRYSDVNKLYGEVEEIMFLDLTAPDSMKPIFFDKPDGARVSKVDSPLKVSPSRKRSMPGAKPQNTYLEQLKTDPAYGKLNQYIISELGSQLPQEELGIKIGTLNNLAKKAHLTEDEVLALFKKSMSAARRNGLSPVHALSVTSESIAFRSALEAAN